MTTNNTNKYSKKLGKSKYEKSRKYFESKGYRYNSSGDITTDLILELNTGKTTNLGEISYDAKKAIENNTLDSYKPKNEEEKKVLEGYKKYTGLFTPNSTTPTTQTEKTESGKKGKDNKTNTPEDISAEQKAYIKYAVNKETNIEGINNEQKLLGGNTAQYVAAPEKSVWDKTVDKVKDFFGNALSGTNAEKWYRESTDFKDNKTAWTDDSFAKLAITALHNAERGDTTDLAIVDEAYARLSRSSKYKDSDLVLALKEAKKSWGASPLTAAGKNVKAAVYGMGADVASFVDSIGGNKVPGLNSLNDAVIEEGKKAREEAANYNKGGYGTALGTFTQGVVNLLPYYFLGSGKVATTTLTKAPKYATYIKTIANNPSFWYSLTTMWGQKYQDALDGGATETDALKNAILYSVPAALVEVGSGIGSQDMGTQKLSSTILEEIGEEIAQDIISGASDKATTNPNLPVLSMTEDAVINPVNLAKTAIMTAPIVAVAGGANIGYNKVANLANQRMQVRQLANDKKVADLVTKFADNVYSTVLSDGKTASQPTLTNSELKKIGEYYSNESTLKVLIDEGLESPKGTTSRTIAEDLNKKVKTKEKISNKEIGELVVANIKQIVSEEVAVGDKFKDTKTGNTVTVVDRDDTNTTVEIETPNGTSTKEIPNQKVESFVESGQIEKIESVPTDEAFNDYESEEAELMATDMSEDVEPVTEVETPTNAVTEENSATENTVVAENETTPVEAPTETVAPQSEMPGVNVGDVYVAGDNTYTITSRDNGRTTYTITDKNGNTTTRETSNVVADINFTKEDAYTKVTDGNNATTTEAENAAVAEETTTDNNQLPEAFKTDESGKIRFNQMNIDYTNNSMRKGQFKTVNMGWKSLTVDGFICGKYGVHKRDKTDKYVVTLLQSGMSVSSFDKATDAKKVATYLNANLSFNDVSYNKMLSGSFAIERTDESQSYLSEVKKILDNKEYEKSESVVTEIKDGKVPFKTKSGLVDYVKSHIGNKVKATFNNGNSEIRTLYAISNTSLRTKRPDGSIVTSELKGVQYNDNGIYIDFKNGVEVTFDFVNVDTTETVSKTETVQEVAEKTAPDTDTQSAEEVLQNQPDSDIVKEKEGTEIEENGNDESGSVSEKSEQRSKAQETGKQSEEVQDTVSGGSDFGISETSVYKRGFDDTSRRIKQVETRKLEELLNDSKFNVLKNKVNDGMSTQLLRALLNETYANDNHLLKEGYEFEDVFAYDIISGKEKEISALYYDEIAEYFNQNNSTDVDSTGKTVTKSILERLKDSIVRNAKGQLIPVYHSTAVDFEKFEIGDIGFHFGSYIQAYQRAIDKEYFDEARFIKAYLDVKNPLVFDTDSIGWNAEQILDKLVEKGILSIDEAVSYINAKYSHEEVNKIIKEKLERAGYDGIAYKNQYESINADSYIVFDDSQIIKINDNKESVKNVEPQSEVLAGESRNDDRGLRTESPEITEQEPTESVSEQLGKNGREPLPQSVGTDGNKPDGRNDSEGVHGRNDADISESETTGDVEKTTEETPETIETEDKSIEKKRPSNKENFVITDDIAREFDNTPPKAEDNIKAIELLLTLENEGRPATAEEKKILAKYKGWGGIDTRYLSWELSRKLYDLYDGQQLREMQSSQNNAFFTPTGVIDAMYNGLKRMGFRGGNILESSMGVGNFFGRMPAVISGKSALTGVELESYTARIAQYLYPGATVINKPFQDVAIRNGSYDLVIGNVPFGTNKISYNKKKYSLHNYFIISSLDKVKDGGIVAVITSSGTLDSYSVDARKAIMDRADVVACYKLPEKVFSRNANTDTTTDLIILKKRASDAKPSGDSILNVTTNNDGLRLNEYFVKHPENVLGTLAKGTNAWGEITTVLDNGDFYDRLNNAMKKLPKDLISGKVELKPIETIVSTSSKPRFFEKNGKIYTDDGAGTATALSDAKGKVARDYIAVRDAYKNLLSAYESDIPETEIKPLRDELTKAYDNFSKKHGAITGDGKKKIGKEKSKDNTFLESDSDYYLVSGLERYDSKENKFYKSALFEKDTLRKKKVTSVDNSSDALAVSLNETGRIDFARMGELTGKSEKQLAEELKGEIVLTPEGDYVLTDIYLSGNIYEKLEKVKGKPEFKEQQEMLEKVLPTPKDASSIMVKLGANYIDTKYIESFSREVFGERIEVSKDSTGRWSIEGSKRYRYGDILNVKYGCDAFNAIQLLEKILNDGEITATKKIKIDNKPVSVFDEKMTDVARQKAEDIKEAFEAWIFKDSDRRAMIVDKYNRTYNNYRPLDYEHISDKLSFDSMDETLKAKLYPHQKKGIARFLFGGNILFAHGVGTGKTFEMIASVMEAKRMGIINKAAMVVPNNKVVDFKNDIAQAYPNAKVLVIDTANKKRQTMLGLVNSNDWDIVLIARTTFTKIPVGAELQTNYINQQLEELSRQIVEAEHDRNISRRKLKGLYTQRDNLAQKLKDLDSETKRDENSVEFEKLGFDCICVDEAHNYKSITTLTKLDIKGLASGSDAQQANDMLMKLDYMRSIDGRIIFGTGTPITNTVSEIYNMMRMVRPDILEDAGIHSLDEWVNTFAKIETHTEIGVDNKIKNKSTQTIRSFINGTEMVGMFRQFADVVFTQDVVKNLPKANHIVVELQGTEELRQIEAEISRIIATAKGKETLSSYTKAMAMANAASIDLKMLSGAESDVNIFKDYSLEELEYEDSKINTMCNYVYDDYMASNDIKGTQIIFCDGGAGSGTIYSFNVHNDIMQKLIERGIPKEEIVIVKNQKDAQLEELFEKVNAGDVRVLIGTSRKMAEGLNVQKRVVSIHHPTVTFKPSDLEQGDARGVRAGNINEEVKIYRYLQGNTFDSYKWQAIDRKGEMINKALRGETVDELEDIGADDDGDAGVDAATAMAITSGNPLVKEKIDIDKEVKRLKTLKQNYMNEYYRYQDAVAKNPGQIRKLTEFAQRIEQDIALRDKHSDKTVISINGKSFDKQSDANKALVEAVKKAPKNGNFTKIGEYNGFDIMFKGDTGGLGYTLVLKGANEYNVEYAGNGNNIARISGVLNRLDAELKRVQTKIETLKSDLEFAKQEVNKPFEKEKDLTEALEKQKDITYRYEHFGESQNTEPTETTDDNEADGETVYSSRDVSKNSSTSPDTNRWNTTVDLSNNSTTKLGKVKEKAIDVANKAIDAVNQIPGVDIPNIENKSVNISEIVKMVKDNFDLPIATGKVTDRRASGIYKQKAEAIRVRIANDLPTIFHELGHHLDKLYKLSSKGSVKDLRKSVSQEFLDLYPDNQKNGEAVAEFVRTYLRNTDEAKALCPAFYNDFINTLSKDDLKAVDIISNVANEYMASGFSERVRASIVSGNVKEKTALSEKAKKMHAEWVDGFLPIKDVVEYVEETTGTSLAGSKNAYTLATNSLNARAIANFNTVHGFRDLNGNIVKGAKSYIECIADVDKKNLNTLDEYLVLKHSLEWIAPENKEVTKKRVFADDTLEDVEAIERRIAEIEFAHPEMKKAAENLYEYQRNILKYIVIPAGGMTEDTYYSLNEKYPCYVPFYRAISKNGAKTKATFANQKSPLKRAKGSGELIISPLESIINNTDKMVKFALRNQTMQVLANYANTVDGFGNFMERVPPDMLPHITDITQLRENFEDALQQVVNSGEDYFAVSELFDNIFGNSVTDFTPIANANKKIVTVLQNGQFSYYQVHDDALYESIAEFTPKQLKGIFSISHKLMQPMKMLITQANPIFGTTNLLRDIGTAYKHSSIHNPIEFAKLYALAVKEVITKGDMYKQWQAMGGGHNSELSANLDQIKETLRQVSQKDMGKARRLLYSVVCHPIVTTAKLNDYVESFPRVMEFIRTIETGGDLQEAIFKADDITTNFKKSGKGSLAKDMNALIMFNNAALQGLDKTYRTLTNKDQSERNKTLLKWALFALIIAAIESFWNKSNDDEGYENLSSYKKNNFYNFSVGDGMFISIPKARETALLDSFTERTIEYVFGNDESFYDFGGYLTDQLLPPMLPNTLHPLDAAHDVLGSTVLGGIMDVGWNKNYMDTPIEGTYDKYLPSNERYNEKTSKAAYALGQTKLARKGDLSPKKIDHLISSYTGILGQANKALFPMNKENRDTTIGLRNKFISDSNYSTDVLNKLYDNRDAAELEWQYDNNINNAIEYEQNSVITSYISGMNKAIKALPGDKQREGRKFLLKTLNEWNYSLTSQQGKMASVLKDESISKDCIFDELPSSELSWTVNGTKYTYQMTPQEYNDYVNRYLKAVETARNGKNSLKGYEQAKQDAKDIMSKYKANVLKGKYLNKAIKQ